MPIHARLAVAVRAKLARARTHATGLAHTVRRSLTDGIVCGFRTIVAVLAALTALLYVSGCPAPAPPANGSISVTWSIQSLGGLPVTCEQVGAHSAALRLRNRSTSAIIATAFPCANSPGTAPIAPGSYDVSFLLNDSSGVVLGTGSDQAGVSIASGRLTQLAPVIFTFGAPPKITVALKLATGTTANCRPASSGGAGITGNTIVLARTDDGCAPVVFTRQRGAEQRGTYQVNCSSPEIASCIEKDETLTTQLQLGSYTLRARGKIGGVDCWMRDDTIEVRSGSSVTRTLGLMRTGGAGCPP